MTAFTRLGFAVLLLGGCKASDQAFGDWWLSWDEATGALSVDHRGQRLLDLHDIGIGTGTVDIEHRSGAYRFSNASESMVRADGFDVRSRSDSPLWLAEVLDRDGDAVATLSAAEGAGGSLRLDLAGTDDRDDRVRVGFGCRGDDTFLGGGAYAMDVDHGGQAFDLWVSEPGTGRVDSDQEPDAWSVTGTRHSTSRASPFLVRPHEPVGLGVDTSARVEVDLCASDPDRWTIAVATGQVGLVVLPGPTPLDVVERHMMLTGPPRIPPDWAFAPWHDASGGDDAVEETAFALRQAGVPASVLRTSDWSSGARDATGDAGAGEWSVDSGRYADAASMARQLEEDGFKWLVEFTPLLSVQTANGEDVKGHTVKTQDGDVYWTADAEGENVALFDPTAPDAIGWARDRMTDVLSLGFDGWLQDRGEWVPPDAVYAGLDPVEEHNSHPAAWHRVASDVIGNQDAVLVTRSGWSGNGADASIAWAGHQQSSFDARDGYPTVVALGIGASIAGSPFFAHDVGGRPTGGHASATRELWFRWCSLGAFSPIMATHQGPAAAGGWRFDHTDETRQHYARYAKEHLALFPYLRGLADVAAAEGTPLLLPPAMQYGGPWDRTDAWLLGDALLVAPVQQEGAVGRDVDLPPDVDWYDYWTGTPVQSGWFEADETAIPVFVAAGTVLPVLTEVPQTLVSDAGSHLTTLQDVDHLRTIRVFGSGGRFEEADGTRYVVRGTPVRQDEVTITMTSGSVDVGGAAVSIRGFRERTYVLEVNP